MPPATRHQKATVLVAVEAGLRAAMRELGHEPAKEVVTSPLADVVVLSCAACHVALSAVVDHNKDRVEMVGGAFRQTCGGAR